MSDRYTKAQVLSVASAVNELSQLHYGADAVRMLQISRPGDRYGTRYEMALGDGSTRTYCGAREAYQAIIDVRHGLAFAIDCERRGMRRVPFNV